MTNRNDAGAETHEIEYVGWEWWYLSLQVCWIVCKMGTMIQYTKAVYVSKSCIEQTKQNNAYLNLPTIYNNNISMYV